MTNSDGLRHLLVLTLVTSGAVACQRDQGEAQRLRSEARDSAGIRIIDNERPPDGSRLGWLIGPEPSVTIGVREGEEPYMLHFAHGASKLPDGRIVVANNGSKELRVFDARGTHLASWGGRGQGPGEFSADLVAVKPWRGDSIIAWNSQSGQVMSVFDAQGNFGRSFRLETTPGDFRSFRSAGAVRADGTILATAFAGGDDVVVEIWNGDGTLSASLGKHPFREVYKIQGGPEGGGRGVATVAFGLELRAGLWGDLALVGVTNRYEIRAFRGDGTLARIVRRDHVPRPTTEADRDRYVERELAGWEHLSPDQRRRMREGAEDMPFAKTFPAFRWIMGDAAGNLWVREYDFPGEERPAPLWTVFDPAGRVLGFVETPKRLRILEIGEDYILGGTVDEMEVESIQLWPLERSGG